MKVQQLIDDMIERCFDLSHMIEKQPAQAAFMAGTIYTNLEWLKEALAQDEISED